MNESSNSFESVCGLAAAEKWCWNIFCGTCGHALFRYAFQQIIRGVGPGTAEWVVCKRREHQLYGVLGPMPRAFNLHEQRALADVVAEASLERIARSATPDWLGYVGLALNYTSGAEPSTRLLTRSLVPQLIAMAGAESSGAGALQPVLEDGSRFLRWSDLNRVEVDVRAGEAGRR